MASSPPVASEPQSPYPPSLALSLLAFHRTIGPIRKQSDAKYGKFADLHTVLEAVTPVLNDQGLLLSQTLSEHEGGTLLITRLVHAPSGEELVASCPIPSLQSLLDRVHQLRSEVLQHYPLDLQLAAIGALPPVLPPRNAEPGAELPPPPPRQPGLRIDDQLKGLYTLLGQLGTTTNPLHGFGGIVTYLRRYMVLSILSLAASDDDGQALGGGHGDDRSQPSQASPQQGDPPSAPRARSRRATAPKPQPTPPAQSAADHADQSTAPQQPALQPAPAGAQPASTAPQQPTAAAGADGADHPLTPAEVQQLISLIRTLPSDKVPELVGAFRQHFRLPDTVLISDYLRAHSHAVFVRQKVEQLKPQLAPV